MRIPSTAPAPLWSSSAVVIADELNLRFAHAQFYLMPTKGSLWGRGTKGVAIGVWDGTQLWDLHICRVLKYFFLLYVYT